MAKKKRREDLILQIIEQEADLVIRVGEDEDGKYADIYSRNPKVVIEEKGLTEQEWRHLEYERKYRERSDCTKKFICPRIGSHAAFCSTSGFPQCPIYRELPEPEREESVYVTILRRKDIILQPKRPQKD